MPDSLARPDYALADNLGATRGTVFLTGTQALIRLPLMQRALDEASGLASRGFISGYRGSPLGMVDQQAWKAARLLDAAGVRFLPAINEELAATAVLGTQRVESDPERTADGVFAMWYGKGPGVDRAGDALKHGNAYGASPHGGEPGQRRPTARATGRYKSPSQGSRIRDERGGRDRSLLEPRTTRCPPRDSRA